MNIQSKLARLSDRANRIQKLAQAAEKSGDRRTLLMLCKQSMELAFEALTLRKTLEQR
jgi:hypothetical protein